MHNPVGYGCRLETAQNEIRVFPRDGVRKRVRFVAERIDIEAATGEITQAAYSGQAGRLTLQLSDSTGLVTTVNLVIKGLQPGIYEVNHGAAPSRRDVKESLSFALPIDQAKNISIQRISSTTP